MHPEDSVLHLKGVGEKSCAQLQTLGIETIRDLWFHLPYRYQDRTQYTPMADLQPGRDALVRGTILKSEITFGRRRSLLVWMEDDTGLLVLRFFYFSQAQKNMYRSGEPLECYGEVRSGPQSVEMVHPETNLSRAGTSLRTDTLTPVYSTTKGMQQRTIRKLVTQAIRFIDQLEPLLPVSFLQPFGFESLAECVLTAHQPDKAMDARQVHAAREYLVFEELTAHHFVLKKIKAQRQQTPGIVVQGSANVRSQCQASLPFTLTAAQERVIDEVVADLAQGYPMQRLVQGDVGSGKTLVALLAGLDCVEAGFQVAFMVPTELLAQQHYDNIRTLLKDSQVQSALLTGSLPAAQRATQEHAIASGQAQIVVGTHALFQKSVTFDNLGLVIVDEQHRFGVAQRLALVEKSNGVMPHQLIMTATPIPRTLAMSFYQFLDYSVVDELPPGRTPVQTSSLPENKRPAVIERLATYCGEGRQAYWVCPLIEESEALQCQTAIDTHATLGAQLPNLRIGLVHGQMKSKEKMAVMRAFKQHSLDVLVATTVIEVGVDVPNASVMVIDNSERLGLAQLHQLRGRVGRGATQSSCVLLYKSPLSREAKARLEVMRQTNDGFVIAQKDLELRGPGELLGKAQTGEIKFRLADFSQDQALLYKVAQMSQELEAACDAVCIEKLIGRWKLRPQAIA